MSKKTVGRRWRRILPVAARIISCVSGVALGLLLFALLYQSGAGQATLRFIYEGF